MAKRELLSTPLRLFLGLLGKLAYFYFFLRAEFAGENREVEKERLLSAAWSDYLRRSSNRETSLIWFHAASVGEFRGVEQVLARLREQRSDLEVLVTTTSLTGREIASQSRHVDLNFLLPIDEPSIWQRVLSELKPDAFVITETEIWPNMLAAISAAEIPLFLMNARISDGAFRQYRRVRFLIAKLFSSYRRIFCQSQLDFERFLALGCEESRLEVVGSTKYDLEPGKLAAEDQEKLLASLGLSRDKPLFIAASVRPGEFEQVIDAYYESIRRGISLQMLIAPRHGEYFDDVAEYLATKDISFSRYSAGEEKVRANGYDVLLLDTIGILSSLYSLADFCFVGGSLVPIGGHNPLEPAAAGVPVLSGPYMSNVLELYEKMRLAGVIEVVSDSGELSSAFDRFLRDDVMLAGRREQTKTFVSEQRGASLRIVEQIVFCLDGLAVSRQVEN